MKVEARKSDPETFYGQSIAIKIILCSGILLHGKAVIIIEEITP